MAPTLSFLQSSPTPPLAPLTAVPPPSQDFVMQQMPNVFVHPPDEELEYNPPWCYFDATQAVKDNLTTHPDMEALDVALSFCQQTDNRAPTFRRTFPDESQDTVVMPRRGSLLNLKFRATDLEMDMELEPDGQTDIRSRGARRYDDDVVEVVKFRRGESVAHLGVEQTVKAKKTSSFRARATQALRSIKNVGKGNRDRRATVSAPQPLSQDECQASTNVQHRNQFQGTTLPTRHSYQDSPIPTPPAPPSLSRRRSLTISHLFTSFKENKENQASRPASPADELLPPTSPTLVDSDSSPSVVRPMSPTDSPTPHPRRFVPSALEDYTPPTPKSTSSTTQPAESEPPRSQPGVERRRSFVRRLSVLELQRLFTGGGSSTSVYPLESAPQQEDEDVFAPSRSRPLSMDSAAILSASSSRASQGSSSRYSNTSSEVLSARPSWSSQLSTREEEVAADLEMRLDSLHFDSLHFDPDEIMSSL